jgi:hypothetical protein
MSPQPLKYLEAVRPSPEDATVLVDPLIKRLAAVQPGPGEAKALVQQMKNDPSSASDRQRLLEILAAEDAARACLSSWTPPRLPGPGQGRAKRNQPRVKRPGRRRRR